MKKILIVAHPDDEILFFSSVLEGIDKVIVCYGATNSKVISDGRKKIKDQYPLLNIEWLNFDESDVWDASDWSKPVITDYGIKVNRNESTYKEKFENLCKTLKTKIDPYDVIYTHNPWGEYGHEEHVSLFQAVLSSVRGQKKKLFVSCYVSDRSQELFSMRKHLLQGEIQIFKVPKDLCSQIKNLYVKFNCWTWASSYEWPDSEIFAQVSTDCFKNHNDSQQPTAGPPIMLFSSSFKQRFLRRVASKALPESVKKIIKQLK